MQDFIMTAITVVFFTLSVGYVYFCERIAGCAGAK
jgi:cbb3-type cytochrome oxidase subunit 3